MYHKTKRFELMLRKVSDIPAIRKEVQEWAERGKVKVHAVSYRVREDNGLIDRVAVEYAD